MHFKLSTQIDYKSLMVKNTEKTAQKRAQLNTSIQELVCRPTYAQNM